MVFAPGPIFANIVLADEINRTPPKTQSALLEAMQEHRVTIQGRTYELDEPFYVFATQNPIELEGTYPLPEAQLDRFMFHIVIEHPPEDEEFEVVRATTAIIDPHFHAAGERRRSDRVPAPGAARAGGRAGACATRSHLVRTSRPEGEAGAGVGEEVRGVRLPACARRSIWCSARRRGRSRSGRYHVSFDDIRAMAHPVLRHRVLTNFRAESEGITTDSIIDELLSAVPVPSAGCRTVQRRSEQ